MLRCSFCPSCLGGVVHAACPWLPWLDGISPTACAGKASSRIRVGLLCERLLPPRGKVPFKGQDPSKGAGVSPDTILKGSSPAQPPLGARPWGCPFAPLHGQPHLGVFVGPRQGGRGKKPQRLLPQGCPLSPQPVAGLRVPSQALPL